MVNMGINIASTAGQSNILELSRNATAQEQARPVLAEVVERVQPEAGEAGNDEQNSTAKAKNDEVNDVVKAIDTVNQKLLVKSTNLVFEFDDVKDPPIIKVVDKENGDVIREIPSKELREIAKALNSIADNLNGSSGILLDEQL